MLSCRNNADTLTGLGVISSSNEFMPELERLECGSSSGLRRYDVNEESQSISPLESASNAGSKPSESRGILSPPDMQGLSKICEAVGADAASAVVASYAVMYGQYCQAFACLGESELGEDTEPSVDSLTAIDMLRDAGLSVMSLTNRTSDGMVVPMRSSSVTSSKVCRASVKHAVSKYPSGLCYARVFRITARESVALSLGFWPTFLEMLSQPVEAALPLCSTGELYLRRVDGGWHLIDALDVCSGDLVYNRAVAALAVTRDWPTGTYGAALASVPVVEPDREFSQLSIDHSLGGESISGSRVYSQEISQAAERAMAVASGNVNPFRSDDGTLLSVPADAYYPLPDPAPPVDDLGELSEIAQGLGIYSDASGSNSASSDSEQPGSASEGAGTRHRTGLPFLSSYSVASGAFDEVSMGVCTPDIYTFVEGQWFTYRRNYSSISVTLKASSFTQFMKNFSDTDRVPLRVTLAAVRRFESEPMDLSARPVSQVPLVGYTTKRDNGSKEAPEPISVGPMDLLNGCVVKFERIQFTRATPAPTRGGGRSYFHFVIQLEGCFLNRWVPLHRTVSYPVAVRGRSPKYFPPDIPLPGDYASYLEQIATSGTVFAQRTGGVTPTRSTFIPATTVLGGLLVDDVAKGVVARVHRNGVVRFGVIFPFGGSARFVERDELYEFLYSDGACELPSEIRDKCGTFVSAVDNFDFDAHNSYNEVVRAGAFAYEICW